MTPDGGRAEPEPARRGGRRRKIALGCGGLLVLVLALFTLSARRFLFPARYDVVPITASAEYQDEARLARARALPVAARYDRAFLFQPNGSVCGPTSLANVARSLGDERASPDSILDGTGKCPFGICFGGLTLDELGEMARARTGRRVTVLRDVTLAALREHAARANDPAVRYVINFDRGPLFGTAGGHHSPIGGYLADEDLVLVLDVNAKYKPWLVKTERLHAAMDTVDPSSGKKRGLLRIE